MLSSVFFARVAPDRFARLEPTRRIIRTGVGVLDSRWSRAILPRLRVAGAGRARLRSRRRAEPARDQHESAADCLLAVDLFTTFDFDSGEKLLASLRDRADGLVAAFAGARERSLPVVYANDTFGIWNGDASAIVERALAGPGRVETASPRFDRRRTTRSS